MKEFLRTYFPPVLDERGDVSVRLTVHHAVYFLLLIVLCGTQPLSNWMMSGMEILIAVNWALEWELRAKISRGRAHPLLMAYLLFALAYVVWLVPGRNYAFGLHDLFSKLPLLAIPLLLMTSRPLNRKQFSLLIAIYVSTVFVTTIVGRVRYHVIPDLPYRDIVPYISHIRFALNVCMAVFLLGWFLVVRWQRRRSEGQRPLDVWCVVGLLMLLSLLHFLFIMQSYTALVILTLTSVVLLLVFGRRISSRRLRYGMVTLFCTVVIALVVVVALYIRDYYKPVPLATLPLAKCTVNGRPYQHKEDGFVENGNLINNYVCAEEMECEWLRLSDKPIYELTETGFTVYPTLLRYLNALGTTKDSAGMQLLTADDVAAIEKGIANPVYLKGSRLRKMVYVMLYEYESSCNYNCVEGFTMLQRFELWRNAWRVFTKHPLLGVGTCDVQDACMRQLAVDGSSLAGRDNNIHNQYLTFLVTFGLVGFLLIVTIFVWALRREGVLRFPIAVAFACTVLISFITENTLSTLAGCVFSVFFLCLFASTFVSDNTTN